MGSFMNDKEWLWEKIAENEITITPDYTTWYDENDKPFMPAPRVAYQDTMIAGCKTLSQAIQSARRLEK